MLWWQLILVAFPELSICNDWGEFVDQLNIYFGQPDLAQASECALCTFKMQDYQHVNKYMVEFSEHATHTGCNDPAFYGEFYQGLAECIKDQLLSLDQPQTFQQLKVTALKCDTHYWECQGKKTTPSGHNRQSASSSAPTKLGNNLTASSDAPWPVAPTRASEQMVSSPGETGALPPQRPLLLLWPHHQPACPDCHNS